MELLLQDVIQALDGECLNEGSWDKTKIKCVSTDSRKITTGCLFIPLKGENFDGHAFISTVFDKGAYASLTEERLVRDSRLCMIYVKNTKKALLRFAEYYRSLFDIPVIGVTGSVGKTSTKEIIAATISARFNVHKTEGNYNNEIGLPLTLLKLEQGHEAAVIEMGMNHFGEIHELSLTARPDIAVITNIGTSHIEHLGSREGILKAKLEILDGLSAKGLLIINGDNDLLSTVENVPFKMVKFGLAEKYPYYAQNIVSFSDYTTAEIYTPKGTYPITITALGEHMIYNTLAAVSILGYPKKKSLEALLLIYQVKCVCRLKPLKMV